MRARGADNDTIRISPASKETRERDTFVNNCSWRMTGPDHEAL